MRRSGPSAARAAADVTTFMTLAVRSGVLPSRSNRTRPVAASRTWPSNVASRGSCASAEMEHMRRSRAADASAGAERAGSAVGVGLGVGGASAEDVTLAEALPARPVRAPAPTDPAASRATTATAAVTVRVRRAAAVLFRVPRPDSSGAMRPARSGPSAGDRMGPC
ncbi:hypothetical protein CMsap09_04745 [Clavibacter michiganensis]|uniref:Uncharacterized protein n=1 Tax=Clavibacter michiganensis TaxID=28447 RepID=A0A251XRM3_9MICO|nr:hypothetical protein CMsap09_04745 [Clavibacter michiganensis]